MLEKYDIDPEPLRIYEYLIIAFPFAVCIGVGVLIAYLLCPCQ